MEHEQSDQIPEQLSIPFEPEEAYEQPEVRVTRSLAALGVIFGTLAVAALPFGLIRFHQGAIPGDFEVTLYDMPGQSPSLQAIWLFFASASGAGLGLMLLVGSVGAVTFRPWSRRVLMLWAIASLILSGCGSIFYFRWLLPPWRAQEAQVRGVIDMLTNFAGWGVGSALAVGMLVLLTRPKVRAAFDDNPPQSI